MSYSVVKAPRQEFLTDKKPTYFETGSYPEFCSCSHPRQSITHLNLKKTYNQYECDTCGFTYTVDSGD